MCKIALLTEKRYLYHTHQNWYVRNILKEDRLISDSLDAFNIEAKRVAWDEPNVLNDFNFALFRTTWNYFDKLDKFYFFLKTWKHKVVFINSYEQVVWNLNKQYLIELSSRGINIPDTLLIKMGENVCLNTVCEEKKWSEIVIKPCISAAAWETYRLKRPFSTEQLKLFKKLTTQQDMLIQSFQKKILSLGEVSLMMIDGKYSHSVIKKAKKGDFRVQDDYGGKVMEYSANPLEINFAKKVIDVLRFKPIYARVDLIVDNGGKLALSELELIEPEMWFRKNSLSANLLARAIKNKYFNKY